MTAEEIAVADEELTTYLLCEECEQRLNRDGENWLLPKLATIEKKFSVLRHRDCSVAGHVGGWRGGVCLRPQPEDRLPETHELRCGGLLESVRPFRGKKGKSAPMIQLGKYGEEFRQFLVGKRKFPKQRDARRRNEPARRCGDRFS